MAYQNDTAMYVWNNNLSIMSRIYMQYMIGKLLIQTCTTTSFQMTFCANLRS